MIVVNKEGYFWIVERKKIDPSRIPLGFWNITDMTSGTYRGEFTSSDTRRTRGGNFEAH